MEIIQTYMSDETEVCVISDGNNIHLADKNDLAVESPKVGTVLRPSQMNEVYLEMPISVLQEAARRSEVFVEPDAEEEEEEEGEEEEGEEDGDGPPPWEPLAREQFSAEYLALDEGVDIRVLINFPVKVRWDEEESASWHTTDGVMDLDDALTAQAVMRETIESFNQRIRNFVTSIQKFTQEQIALGHELDDDSVETFLGSESAHRRSGAVAEAAE